MAQAAVIGAGVGGLVCAIALAARGVEVSVFERGAAPGGKLRTLTVDGVQIDSGPTVFTMRWVFDEVFEEAGARLDDHLRLRRAARLARHAWPDGARFDLMADLECAAEAVSAFAGRADAAAFLGFAAEARRIYKALEQPFLNAQRPGPVTLARRIGLAHAGKLLAIRPFETLWGALARRFRDQRLVQLFARYATYAGSNPFAAPATLMLIAHVEQEGVWLVEGGMQNLARALAALARSVGVEIRCEAAVDEILVESSRAAGVRLAGGDQIRADAIVLNADAAALASGRFGNASRSAIDPAPRDNSLSAITWSLRAQPHGFPLLRHNVFFSDDYVAEFRALFGEGRLPNAPTIYVCAQDRGDEDAPTTEAERLFVLVNAPARGQANLPDEAEIARCETMMFASLARSGLTIAPTAPPARTSPKDFAALFPGTSGALYGPSTHGPWASFRRPGARTRLPGLYLAGASAHPGAGLPMAALSGRLAAQAILADLNSIARSRRAATPGGISTL